MNDVLLTVSGTIPADLAEQVARGDRPEPDYVVMARTFGADLLDYAKAREVARTFGKLLEKIGGANLVLAWACFVLRHKYHVIFTDGEQIGLPLAFLLKFLAGSSRPGHLMIVHILSVGKKIKLIDWFRLHTHIDLFLAYATWQKNFIEERWDLPAGRVVWTPFMVNHHFFAPDQAGHVDPIPEIDKNRPITCGVGLEFRDYPTLLEAVKGLDIQVIIAAASPWSKRSDSTAGHKLPDNVLVRRFTQFELREVYAVSDFLTMPLYNVDFQAGVTALLEGMAMELGVICSSTPGQTDVVIDGETGVYVPPEDPQALRQAIQHWLDHPKELEAMGKAGRKRIEKEMSLDYYVQHLNPFVQAAREASQAQGRSI